VEAHSVSNHFAIKTRLFLFVLIALVQVMTSLTVEQFTLYFHKFAAVVWFKCK